MATESSRGPSESKKAEEPPVTVTGRLRRLWASPSPAVVADTMAEIGR